jgi:hypothetical protein
MLALLITASLPRLSAATGPIFLGVPVQGHLAAGQSDTWNIDLAQGMFVRISMSNASGSKLVPEIILTQDSGGTLAVNHSTTGTGTAQIEAPCLPGTGRYAITARSFEGTGSGAYNLVVVAIQNFQELGPVTQPCPATDTWTDHTNDKCGRELVGVHPAFGDPVDVQKGETKYIFIPDTGEIKWDCKQQGEFDDERAKCVNGSNLVRIIRGSTGRDISWDCYTRSFVENTAAGSSPLTASPGVTTKTQQEERYAAIWEKSTGPAWVARHGLTSAQYQQEMDTMVKQGYRPVLVSGFDLGSEDRYAAIWEKSTGPAPIERHGLTSAQYQQEMDTLVKQGYRLMLVSGYDLAGQDSYAAIWEKSTGPERIERQGLTAAQ